MLKRASFHTNSYPETFLPVINWVNRWRFAQSDARHRLNAASVHRHHEIAIPFFVFYPHVFVVNWVQFCAVGWQKVWWNERRCLVSEGWLSCRLGKQEHCLAGRLTCHRSYTWQALAFESEAPYAVACTIDLHSSIDKHQVHWTQLGHTHGHHHWLTEGWACLQQTF